MNWDLVQEATARRDGEWGVHYSTDGRIRIVLATPTRYYVGMSSLGFQAVYGMLNAIPDVACERTFLPDDPRTYQRTRTPLFSLESLSPISSFDIVAFSIACELELPGLFEVLELGGIPAFRHDRGVHHPLVIAGGPLTWSNPLPLAPFVDAIVMGEAEPVLERVASTIRDEAGRDRADVLAVLAELPGVYVPAQHGDMVPALLAAVPSALPAVSRRVTRETDLSNMFLVEASRGCSRACAYCVMRRNRRSGMRVVPAERILSRIPEETRRVGLVGAAVSDHPELPQILEALLERGIGTSVSSLRADRMTPALVDLLRRAGYHQLTVAADGASERLRRRLGRRVDREHLLQTAELASRAGMSSIKVYAMLGVPGEGDEDIDELVRLVQDMGKSVQVTLAVSFFVPKRGTPLAGAPFEEIKELSRRLGRLGSKLGPRATLRPASARWAWVEYRLATGTSRTGEAAFAAWKDGGGFAAWRRALARMDSAGGLRDGESSR